MLGNKRKRSLIATAGWELFPSNNLTIFMENEITFDTYRNEIRITRAEGSGETIILPLHFQKNKFDTKEQVEIFIKEYLTAERINLEQGVHFKFNIL